MHENELHCPGQLYGNVFPNNNENNRILTSSSLPVCSKRRPLLQCIPFLFALVLSDTVTTLRLKPALIGAVVWRAAMCAAEGGLNAAEAVSPVTSKLSQQVSRPQGWPLEKQEHERCE